MGIEPVVRAAPVSLSAVTATTLRVPLPEPARVGAHVIREREYALVRVAGEGREGFAYGLTRGAPIVTMVRALVAPHYTGQLGATPPELFDAALRSNPTVLSTGSGLRALSLADMAAWDLLARSRDGLDRCLGGDDPRRLRALVVVGFPPSMALDRIASEARGLYERGWRAFKLAIGPDRAATRARLEAAVVGPDARLVLDAAWTWRDADEGAAWVAELADLPIEWVEDPFPPGDAAEVARLRSLIPVALGTGDEQGGAYFPEALLAEQAVDVLRVDATAVGGVTGFAAVAEQVGGAATLSCHVHGHLHGQLLRGLGLDGWVEFGRAGSGVDPLGDVLLPEVVDGLVADDALRGAEPAIDEARLWAVGCTDPLSALGELRGAS